MAATSRITSVMAASGRVMVRATAKLRSVASMTTATTAVHGQPGVDRPQERSCSVRERRISATGPVTGQASVAGGGQRPRQHHVVLVADAARSCDAVRLMRAAKPSAPDALAAACVARTWPSIAERDVAAGHRLQLRRERVVEQEADAERAEDSGWVEADRDRHGDELQHAVGLRQQAQALVAGQRVADRRLTATTSPARGDAPNAASTPPDAVGHEQQVRIELEIALDVLDRPLHRGRVVGVERGRLELRDVGDEPRQHGEGLGAGRPELIDEGAGRDDLALQRTLGLPRRRGR